MKIAFLISSMNAGGAEKVVSILSNKIIENNEVIIITLNKRNSFFPLDQKIKLIQCNVYNKNGGFFNGLLSNFIIIFRLIRIIKSNSINHLICFMTTSNILGIISGKLLRKKVTISERANPHFMGKCRKKLNRWNILRKLFYRFSDKLVVQSKENKKYYSSYIDNRKIDIIYNPVLKQDVDFSKKEKIILTVGRCDKNKNQELIIRLFANINNKNWKLIICGDGPLLKELRELAFNLGIKDQVEFLGNINNVNEYYKKASIFAFSSISEGFPNVLLEAMSFGCVCISTDCPTGPSLIIDDNINGFLIPLNDLDNYFKILNQIISDDFNRNKIGKLAMNKSEKFNVDDIVKKWEIN